MAKKARIFSQIFLGVASALTLSYASQISPVHACEGDESGTTNCVEEATPSEVYAEADAEVSSERTVDHSLFLAGNQVVSKDKVSGIAALAGNVVEFDGDSEYGAFAGNILKINGTIEKDLFVAGKTIELSEKTKIGRDLYGAASALLINGELKGNVFIWGETVTIGSAPISGDLAVNATKIIVEDGASVTGKFKYNENAEITGLDKLSYGTVETYAAPAKNTSGLSSIESFVIFTIGKLLVIIVMVSLASKFSKRLLDEFEPKNAWKDLALGFALMLGTPLAAVFTMITFIGLPLGAVGLAFYILFIYLSSAATGGVLGNIIAKKIFKKDNMHVLLKYTIGFVLITLLGLLPYFGGFVTSISSCYGFGYIIHKIFRQNPKNKK